MQTYLGLTEIDAQNLTPTDLSGELALAQDRGIEYHAYRVRLDGEANTCYLLWFPVEGRAGIACGGDADWTDANSPEHAVKLWLAGEMVN